MAVRFEFLDNLNLRFGFSRHLDGLNKPISSYRIISLETLLNLSNTFLVTVFNVKGNSIFILLIFSHNIEEEKVIQILESKVTPVTRSVFDKSKANFQNGLVIKSASLFVQDQVKTMFHFSLLTIPSPTKC